MWAGSTPARSRRSASGLDGQAPTPCPPMCRSWMPERVTIHSSVVSRRASRSALVTTVSGRAPPHPVIALLRGSRAARPDTRSQATGCPATTRSPGLASQAAPRCPRTGCGPRWCPRPCRARRPRRAREPGSVPSPLSGAAVATASAVASSAARPATGSKTPAEGRSRHPLGGVEVLALMSRRHRRSRSRCRRWRPRACRDRRERRRVTGLEVGKRAAGQPGEHAARADLDDHRVAPVPARVSRLWRHRTGLHSCAESRPGHSAAIGVDPGVDVGDHRDLGRVELARRALAEPGPGRGHERGVEGAGHRDGEHLAGAELLGPMAPARATASAVPAMTT